MRTEDVVTGFYFAPFLQNFVHYANGVVGAEIPCRRERFRNKSGGVSTQPEGLSGILFVHELERQIVHRERVLSLHFVDGSLQFLTGDKLEVVTGTQTLTKPSLLITTGPVVSQQRVQLFCFTAISFILVTNLNQTTYNLPLCVS